MSGADVIAGGRLGELIRSKRDWSSSKLGSPNKWPQSLLTALGIVLSTRFPMVIFWGEHLCVLYNDAYIPIFGAKHPDVLGKTGFEAWGEVWDVIFPMFEQVRRGEATWSEDQFLALNRRGFVEETYHTWSYSPIRDESGKVGGVLTVITETTPRVFGERRLATLRELGEHIAEAKEVGQACATSMATLAKNPHDVPNAAIYLLDAAGERARLACSYNMGDAGPEHIAVTDESAWPLGRVARSGQAHRLQALDASLPAGPWPEPTPSALVLPIAKPGQNDPYGLLVVGLSPRLLYDEDYASFLGLVAQHLANAIANATAYEVERKRAEALAEIDRAKTAFFSNVSHEFRTPLTLMIGPIEDALASSERALSGENLETTHRNAQRLLKLVNALLDFSRIESGRVQASYEKTDLSAFTGELASVFRSAVERAGLRFVVKTPPIDAAVYVDREMWEKIVLNLLSNALKFTFEGEIAILLRAERDAAVLTVRDTGTGVPAAEVPHLFERFHRVRGAKGRTHEGSGIGLALVSELVKLHGGAIKVESTEGNGTSFEVRLPTGKAHLAPEKIVPERRLSGLLGAAPYVEEALRWVPSSARSQRVRDSIPASDSTTLLHDVPSSARILLADDNADMREYLARLLSTRWHVEAVRDGQAAIESIRREPPALVLSDVMMPRLDGFGLLRELRADPTTRSLPVILLSARAGEESTMEGLLAGANDYLIKPFSARELLARVSSQLTIASIRKEIQRTGEENRRTIEALFNDAPAPISLLRGPDLVLEYLNPRGYELWNRSPESGILGKPLLDALPEMRGQGYDDLMRQVMRTGETFLANEAPVTMHRFGKDEVHFLNLVYSPTRDARGVIDGVSVFAFDVTSLVDARNALARSEARFRMLADSIPQLAWIADAHTDGQVNWFNRGWLEYTGCTLEEMKGSGWKAVHHPDYVNQVAKKFEHHVKEGLDWEDTFPLRGADGQYRWFLSRMKVFRDESGTVSQIFGTNTDITEQRETHAALEHERNAGRRLIETLFNDAPAAITLIRGPELVIEFANTRCVELWQRSSASEVVGKPFLDALPELRDQGFEDLLRQVMTSGEPFFGNDAPATLVRDGKEVSVRLNFVYVPTRNAHGSIDGVSVFAFDVTAQARARDRAELGAHVGRAFVTNETLAEQLRHCCEALVTMGAAFARIWTYDTTHEVLELRASAGIYTHTNGAHARVPLGSLKIGRMAQTRQPHLTNTVIGDPYVDQEWAKREGMRSFAGYPLIVGDRLVGVVALFAKSGLSEETLVALSTVADQIALGIDRDAGERFRELFIGMLGHDLRNPLNAVLMATHLLSTTASEPQKRPLSRIQNSAKRMERMIAQILDFTRARSGGGIPLALYPADLRAICEQAAEELATANPERTIEIKATGDAHGQWDADRMAQVFSNLIGNAITHGRRDAPIQVMLDAGADEVRLTVHNDGEPIPAELLPSLFDPFRRARHSKTSNTQGLGLGLFISRQIIAAHGGSISVQSPAEGGTFFRVVLPKRTVPR